MITSNEKWNLIVDGYNRLKYSPESKVQEAWEMYCAELFDYKTILHEIDAQRHLTIGSGGTIIPDIILRVSGRDIFDIELKQYSLPFQESFETQLISYLNQTHISVGMVVCDKIYLYYYEYATISINKIEIPFNRDDQDGVALMDMLTKGTFSVEKIGSYIMGKIRHRQCLEAIQQRVSKNWIESIVKEKLLEEYSSSDIEEALEGYLFEVKKRLDRSRVIEGGGDPLPVSDDWSGWIKQWCTDRENSGDLTFVNQTSKYTRFVTDELNTVFPYQNNKNGGWHNGHFYAYEITYDRKNDRFKMWLVFSNDNAPAEFSEKYDRIMRAIDKRPGKESWLWWGIFSTSWFQGSSATTQEDIFRALDAQFAQVHRDAMDLLTKM